MLTWGTCVTSESHSGGCCFSASRDGSWEVLQTPPRPCVGIWLVLFCFLPAVAPMCQAGEGGCVGAFLGTPGGTEGGAAGGFCELASTSC